MSLLKTIVKKSFHAAGFDVSRIRRVPAPRPPSPLVHHGIELLFDVGANAGQYAMLTRTEGYDGRIVSFEPLPDAFEALARNAASDPLWTVHERCALGAVPGEAELNIAGNSYSSSLLPMLHTHSDAAPDSVYVAKALTKVITLDSVFDRYRTRGEKVFVKIDTQGFEAEVLKGASECLRQVYALELELSLVPLYENQQLYDYFLALLSESGFFLWSLSPVFSDQRTGQSLQVDGVFVRKS